MPQPTPVGKRPMLDAETLNKVVKLGRFPDLDRWSEDGTVLYECFGIFRDGTTVMYRTRAKKGGASMTVHVGTQQTEHGNLRVITASYPNHFPSWSDMGRAVDTFFDRSHAQMMVFPEKDKYINDHPFALWVWDMPEKWGWPPRSPRSNRGRHGRASRPQYGGYVNGQVENWLD